MKRTAVGYQSIRDDEVRTGTGKGWKEWCELIEGAQVSNNTESIIAYLCAYHGIDQLWAKIIAIYYKWRI